MPYFKFYVRDWLASSAVSAMTRAEKGAYIELLARMWEYSEKREACYLPADDDYLCRILGATKREWKSLKKVLIEGDSPVFRVEGDRLTNARLSQEWEKAHRTSESRAGAANARWAPDASAEQERSNSNANALHMQSTCNANDMLPTDSDSDSDASAYPEAPTATPSSSPPEDRASTRRVRVDAQKPEPDPDNLALARLLAQRIRQNNPNARITKAQGPKWADVVRLMRERDGRTPDAIRAHIEWTQSDPFWMANCLSMDPIRKHWDAHELRMTQSRGPAIRASPPAVPVRYLDAGEEATR